MARPRIEPHVQDVALANERSPMAGRTGQAFRYELLDRALVPGVGAVLLEDGGRTFYQRGRQHRLAARGTVHCRDRDAPGALARDAPVRPVADHVEDSIPAPRRDPRHVL